jgi:hypothetical protein
MNNPIDRAATGRSRRYADGLNGKSEIGTTGLESDISETTVAVFEVAARALGAFVGERSQGPA